MSRIAWRRLEQRDPGKWDRERKRQFIDWARWHRGHAADPAFVKGPLTDGAWADMRWELWSGWKVGDRRWRTDILDTTDQLVDDCASDLTGWIEQVRDERNWPLRRGWIAD